MGTSGAYGGSPGWTDTQRDTVDWLNSRPSEGGAGTGPGGPDQTEGPQPHVPASSPPTPLDNPRLIRLLRGVAGHLSRELRASGTGGAAGGGGDGASGGGRRGRRRAAASGGIALAGAYGLRNHDAAAVSDAGLSLADLDTLPRFEQARRIVDAASGRSGLVEEAELGEVNANFVYWALMQEPSPSPMELLRQWLTEYVFRVWLTEAGVILRDGSRDGASTHALEREVRVTLEACMSGMALPVDGIRAEHFEAAIPALLGMLHRIYE